MLHPLGKKSEKDPRDLVARLVDCHARIREMIGLAQRLAAEPRAADDEMADSAGRVRRYFRRALPFHVRDEEDSIAPRLAEKSPALGASLDRMRREHLDHEPDTMALAALCDSLAESPSRWPELAPAIREHADVLAKEFATHLEEEERDIFPAIAALLDDATRDQILTEMDARRDADGGGGRGRGRGRAT